MMRIKPKYTGTSVNIKRLRLELNKGPILILINFTLFILILFRLMKYILKLHFCKCTD